MGEPFSDRRGFLGRLSAAAAVLVGAEAIGATGAGALTRQAAVAPDKWLDGMTGKHRTLFDFPLNVDGMPLIHMLNYMSTYKTAYGAAPGEVNAIGTFYGAPGFPASMPLAWNDAMWAKYKVGQMLKLNDPKGGPTTHNMFFRPMAGDPIFFSGAVLAAGIESLQKMGATFLMCNNAFMAWVGVLAGMGMGKAADIEKDIRANLLPGVVTVPAMVIAIEKAQGRGIAYNRQ